MSNRAARDRDYYALLGVGSAADEEEIRRAFRALARRLHPDVNHAPDAATRFAAVLRAYTTLSDAEQRRAYDRAHQRSATDHDSPLAATGPFTHGGSPAPRQGHDATTGRGAYGMPAGRARFDASFAPERPAAYGDDAVLGRSALRGLDVHHTVHLTLEEAARGTTRSVVVPRQEICILCRGTGAAPGGIARACPTCWGSGRTRSGVDACVACGGSGSVVDLPCRGCGGSGRRQGLFELEGIRFPAGVPSGGYAKRVKGEGEPGPRGGPRGELLLHVVVDDDAELRRAGPESADILGAVHISAAQARRGGRVSVRTVQGPATLRVPRGVSSGTIVTLRGKGLRRHRQFGKGNHHVTVFVEPDAAPG